MKKLGLILLLFCGITTISKAQQTIEAQVADSACVCLSMADTARIKTNEQHCWYLVPEMIIGVPKYDNGACIAYIIDKFIQKIFKL